MPRSKSLSREDFAALEAVRPSLMHGKYVTVVWAPLPGLAAPKAAAVVSKKVSNRAVDRNKVQRRLRDILRPLVAASRKPLAVVVRAKKEARGADMAQLRADVEPLIVRVLA